MVVGRRGDLAIHWRRSEVKTHHGGLAWGAVGAFVSLVVRLVNYGVIITVIQQTLVQNQVESETFERVARPVTRRG